MNLFDESLSVNSGSNLVLVFLHSHQETIIAAAAAHTTTIGITMHCSCDLQHSYGRIEHEPCDVVQLY